MKPAAKQVRDASKARPRDVHGEHRLAGIEFLKVELEGGKVETFNISSEVMCPAADDHEAIVREAQRAPARLVFWDYQTARIRALLRTKEVELAKREGEKYSFVRDTLREDGDGQYIADANVRAAVDYDDAVIHDRIALAELRFQFDVLKCVRDAVEHRTYILRKLLDHLPVAILR